MTDDELPPLVGQPLHARGAVKKPYIQVLLQLSECLARRLGTDAERLRCLVQAAQLRSADKDRDRSKFVHCHAVGNRIRPVESAAWGT